MGNEEVHSQAWRVYDGSSSGEHILFLSEICV